MASTLHFTITAHGLGHLTRSLALARALHALDPEFEFVFSTHIPERRLRRELPFAFRYRDCRYEPGTAHFDCFRTDLEQTRADFRAFFAERTRRLAEEESFLEEIRPVGVISDIPALAIRAASNKGIPSIGVSNFTWDWILESILKSDDDREILETLRSDYACGLHHFRLPFGPTSSPFPSSEAAPLVSRYATRPAHEIRTQLDIPPASTDARKLVLVCPGGWDASEWEPIHVPDCEAFRFLMVGDLPVSSDAPTTHLAHELPSGIEFPDLLAAADLMLAKPGYGTASECVVNQTALIAIERPDFRETPGLLDQLGELGRLTTISLTDFLVGNWQDALTAAIADQSPWAVLPKDPARIIASRIATQLKFA